MVLLCPDDQADSSFPKGERLFLLTISYRTLYILLVAQLSSVKPRTRIDDHFIGGGDESSHGIL
jgi:hypothetical protein